MKKNIRRIFDVLLILLIAGCSSQPMVEPEPVTSTPTLPIITLTPTTIPPHPLAITVENASSLKLEKIIGAGKVNDVAWSPLGDVIAVVQDFDILFYDSASLQLIGNVGFGGTEVVFSPDGKNISIVQESSVIVWHISNNEVVWEFETFDTWGIVAKNLIYNNQGSYLTFWEEYIYDASIIYVLEVWDLNSGEQIYREEDGGSDVHVEFSPNDKLLAIHSELDLKLINLDTGEQKIERSLWSRDSFTFLDNNFYFGRTEEGQLTLIDINTFKIKSVFDIKIDFYASKFLISPDKNKMIVFNFQNESLFSEDIQVWDLEKEKQLFSIDVKDNYHNFGSQVLISPDSSYFIVLDDAGYIMKYDLETGKFAGEIEFTTAVSVLEFLPANFDSSSYSLVTGYLGGQIRIWDNNQQLIRKFEDHKGQINSIEFNTDYSQLISASNDFTAKIWDISTGSLLRTVKCLENNFIESAMFSENQDFIALECAGKIEIQDTKTWAQIDSMDGYDLQRLPP